MFRVVAIALVALAAYDFHFLDGKYTYAVDALARSLAHFIGG